MLRPFATASLLSALLLANDPEKILRDAFDAQSRNQLVQAHDLLASIRDAVERSPDTGLQLAFFNNFGAVLLELGRFREATRPYEQALQLAKEQLGESHLLTLTIQTNLATTYGATLRWTLAEQLQRRVLRLKQDHHHSKAAIAAARGRLAGTMASTGRESEAQSLLEQTRQDLAHAKEPQELEDLAAQLNMLGWIYLRNGRVPDAKQVFSEALDLTLKAFDGQDLAVATAHRNLGSTALAEHEWAEAAAQFESALDVAHAIAPRHPRLKDLLEEYATALDKLHRKSEAKAARRRAASLEQDPVTAATARQTVHVGQLKH